MALIVLSAAALTGCGSIVTTSGSGTTTTLVSGPTVVIGYLGPLSGTGGVAGREAEDGAQLAVQQFQADHPSYRVEWRPLDIANIAVAAARASELVGEGVVGVIGPTNDAEAAIVDPVLSRAGVPQIVVGASGDDLADAGIPGFHRVAAGDSAAGADAAAFLFQKNANSVAVVGAGPADLAWRTSLTQTLAADEPATISYYSLAPAAATVATVAASVVAADPAPAWVTFAGDAITGGQLVSALRVAGYGGDILLAGDSGNADQVQEAAWVAAGYKAYLSCACDAGPGSSTPDVAFVDAYRAANGVAPGAWSAQAFDAANAILDATVRSLSSLSSPPLSSSTLSSSPPSSSPPSSSPPSSSPPSSSPRSSPSTAIAQAPSAAGVEKVLDSLGYSFAGLSGTISFTTTGNLADAPVWISDVAAGKITQEDTPVTAPASAGAGG